MNYRQSQKFDHFKIDLNDFDKTLVKYEDLWPKQMCQLFILVS